LILSDKIEISASIVLYKENVQTLKSTVKNFLKIPLQKKLFLIDNSPTNTLENQFKHPEIEFIFNDKNLGFGKAHNLVIDTIKSTSKYHLVLNPDIVFNGQVIVKLIAELQKNKDVSLISPKILYPDESMQYYCRKYPSFFELIYRRLGFFKSKTYLSEYRNLDLNKSFYPECMHGCFMLFKTTDFVNINGFDERYFLYMEDIDICKKIDVINKKKMYYPNVVIEHLHQRGSAENIKLLFYHLLSARKYFKKWKN
jgi:GT2 family glycosyltransferase